MWYLFQSTGRLISHWNGWTFRVYMILLRDFVPEWNSRPRIRTRVNSRQGESCQYNILWWYHVNKYRAMIGNQSELAPGRKLPWCHVNTPWVKYMCSSTFHYWTSSVYWLAQYIEWTKRLYHTQLVAYKRLNIMEKILTVRLKDFCGRL